DPACGGDQFSPLPRCLHVYAPRSGVKQLCGSDGWRRWKKNQCPHCGHGRKTTGSVYSNLVNPLRFGLSPLGCDRCYFFPDATRKIVGFTTLVARDFKRDEFSDNSTQSADCNITGSRRPFEVTDDGTYRVALAVQVKLCRDPRSPVMK